MGLGDSFTYGVGVDFDDTYLSLLEKKLNTRGKGHKHIRIIKAGIPRHFPLTERLLFEKYSAIFEPKLIIIGFLPNDIIDTYYGLNVISVDKKGYLVSSESRTLGSYGIYIYRYCHIFRILWRYYLTNFAQNQKKPGFNQIFKENGMYEKEWQKVESEYKKIIKISNKTGSKTIIMLIPQKGIHNDNYSYIANRLSEFGSQNGAYFHDTRPDLIKASKNKILYYEKDGHCTPDGYRVIANSIYRFLTVNNLVP